MKKIPSLLFVVLLWFVIGPWASLKSLHVEYFIWSRQKFACLIVLFLLSLYLLVSLRKVLLVRINNFVLCSLFFAALLLEIELRLYPDWVPNPMLRYLPKEPRQTLAKKRGLFTVHSFKGEGMVYHRNPEMMHGIPIDTMGYRNPKMISEKVDVVILGDSMTLATASKEDIGELFRKRGISSLNLGMDRYSPQLYRDAYKKYILDRNIRHTFVFIFIYMGNDFYEAQKYENIVKNQGTWVDYLGYVDENTSPWKPWVIGFVTGMIKDSASLYGRSSEITLSLPYRTLHSSYFTWSPRIHENERGWQYSKHAFEDIIRLSKQARAKPVFFLLPSSAALYSDFSSSFKEDIENHKLSSLFLKKYFMSQNIVVVDLWDDLNQELHKHFIFSKEDDFHFNDKGVKKVFEAALKYAF